VGLDGPTVILKRPCHRPEFIPQLQAQLADITALRDDAAERGWHTVVARHSRVITSLQNHLQRLTRTAETGHTT